MSAFGMDLENRMETKVGLLSGGQRQVVTLLMSTLVSPKLLLLDEHTAALDPAAAHRVMEITKEIVCKGKITTMMITHNMEQALSTGSRTLLLDEGRILLDLSQQDREGMKVEDLLELYSQKTRTKFQNDRMLLV